jgi:drug/metabolite transporter (DMT)-like permease
MPSAFNARAGSSSGRRHRVERALLFVVTQKNARSGPTERSSMANVRLLSAVMWMGGSLLSFSVLAVSIREVSKALSVSELLALRAGIGLAIVVVVGLLRPHLWQDLSLSRLGLHVVRNGVHYGAQTLWATGITLLPLATVFALEFTMPAWTALLAVTFLGERMTASRFGVVILGFIGVLVIVRPGYEAFQPAAVLVLLAALGYGVSMTATKQLTRSQTTFAIVFWMNLMQLPMTMASSDPLFVTRIEPSMILPALAIGVTGLSSHFCLSNAFRAADAVIVVPMDFLRIPLIAVIGWALYGELVDVFVVLGAGLIIAGVLWNLIDESRSQRKVGVVSEGRT